MAYITEEQVKELAHVARIQLSDEEVNTFAKQLDELLQYVQVINEVNTDDVEPLTHALPIQNAFREDEVESSLSIDLVVKNAPDHQDGQFKVPSVLE